MSQFVQYLKWSMKTAWPLYALTILFTNGLGAMGVATFLRFLMPLPSAQLVTDINTTTATLYAAYFAFALVAGVITTLIFFAPVLRWQRNPSAYDPNMMRDLVLRIPTLQTVTGAVLWGIGVAMFTVVAAHQTTQWAIAVAITGVLGGLMVQLMTYMEAQRLVRPVAARALMAGAPDHSKILPVGRRLMLTWALTTAVPVVGMLLVLWGDDSGFFASAAPGWSPNVRPALIALAGTTLISGMFGTYLFGMSIADPIRELQYAINNVRRGSVDTVVRIYDSSEVGVLQAGFNEMMRGLRERQRVSDLFGRYVGTEVAKRALEEKPELGGETRHAAVLFVDVVGSTSYAKENTPEHVVKALNEFFDRVVDVVHRNKGIINKFEGDAALAMFGAPLPLDDVAGHAMAAARELRAELKDLEFEAGIGVAAGTVVAGHIGAKDRFEYTVIGDAVNTAARITDLAKDTPGRCLTTAATLREANEAEQARWTLLKSVELRGRREMTQLARPIRPTLADRDGE
ncbi:adenylate/guanylate cyclase domain-containing protein [Corynebacterium sp. 320]|uniref:Adenylate/guanylate cyclase domain-containing protein n=1 Tax=Corynebacterium zhongnanshanii TaxID=2768834 RepID=A0ABQ6VE01_9CORY|nr:MULTISPECIES: adenylate/guanylate cyclase domain-containing protein [Corynebacterium]KAB1502901.1 adenylate/guanylate cyclase domain-containing protein [Corynebacterium sp. 320]KAB1552412.1 adenylate/guanylate cyclase domain-containing protein [Corynebacterium sp. 321]KAB1554373.1 adenylate/guanylate cyclase domain-containing protein [Corynebacterium sp. 319]KAB3522656.1 adenylate/guanylate cyclase domain-containing protein [Corynebacterium zhongnanshanii]KAB3526564.1 adenylate/guanylate cy